MILRILFATFLAAWTFMRQVAALDTSLGGGSQDIVTWDKA